MKLRLICVLFVSCLRTIDELLYDEENLKKCSSLIQTTTSHKKEEGRALFSYFIIFKFFYLVDIFEYFIESVQIHSADNCLPFIAIAVGECYAV